MNLNAVTQALNGEIVGTDPLREREYKRARKQVSDGIHGIAVGLALLIAAALPYILNRAVGVPLNNYIIALALALALVGIIKLFRSIGSVIDAKVGQKLLDPNLQLRSTGGLSAIPATTLPSTAKSSQRLSPEVNRAAVAQPANTRPFSIEQNAPEPPAPERTPKAPSMPLSAFEEGLIRPGTGRINREHSTPLRRLEQEDDLMSKLRN